MRARLQPCDAELLDVLIPHALDVGVVTQSVGSDSKNGANDLSVDANDQTALHIRADFQ
jgi:hypothetical protein